MENGGGGEDGDRRGWGEVLTLIAVTTLNQLGLVTTRPPSSDEKAPKLKFECCEQRRTGELFLK